MPKDQPFEIPQQLRQLAEMNVQQARVAFGQLIDAMAQAMAVWAAAMPSHEAVSAWETALPSRGVRCAETSTGCRVPFSAPSSRPTSSATCDAPGWERARPVAVRPVGNLYTWCAGEKVSRSGERDKLALPCVESLSHLAHVRMTIVDRGPSRHRPRDVVQQPLGHMRRRAECREIGRHRAAQVMERPRRNRA